MENFKLKYGGRGQDSDLGYVNYLFNPPTESGRAAKTSQSDKFRLLPKRE